MVTPKRVAIVTVFNEYFNYGSFLQAFALQEYLHQHQISVDLIEEFSFKRLKTKLRRLMSKRLRRLRFNLVSFVVYTFANLKLNSVYKKSVTSYYAVILGSDEIWNLNNITFEHSPMFFGDDIKANRRISYAPSANGMTFDDFVNSPIEKDALSRIEYLSARDPLTVDLVKAVTSRNVVEVLDPTFLIDWSRFEKTNTKTNYILVYCYNLNAERIKLIEELAANLRAEIIVVGHYSDTSYETVVVDPFLFLGYIKNARAVVTDSFHGTVFSIQYNKEFCSFVEKNYKVGSVLEGFGLSTRNASLANNLTSLFDHKIDYVTVNSKMAEKKKVSIQFLNGALDIKS